MTDLQTRLLAVRELGPSALFSYAAYRLGLANGLIRRRTPPPAYRLGLAGGLTRRRTPAQDWQNRPFESWIRGDVPTPPGEYAAYRARLIGPRFFFDAAASRLPWTSRGAAPGGP